MRQQLLRAVRAHSLWAPGERVAVAVSGGRDSMALLHLLVATRGTHRAVLSAVHVDHGLHPESGRWAGFVRDWCQDREIPVQVHRVEVVGGSEAAARSARYAVFDALETDHVALAHHARDQAETVLLNLVRGTGPRGLGGMAFRRGRYVRPLLGTSTASIGRYAATECLTWVEDPSNSTDTPLRNRIRRHLIPALEALRAGAVDALSRSASIAAEDAGFLDDLASTLPLDLAALQQAPRPLARRRIRQLHPGLTVGQVEAVLAAIRAGRGEVQIGRTTSIRVVASGVRLHEASGSPSG